MVNTQNQIVYAVNSDLDDGILYAEFATKEEAIDYAKKHLDKLPFVDELEVTYDANGEIEDVLSYKTIWAHNEEEATPETEDDYWDDLAAMYDEEQANKHDLGDTTWFESMDNLVETLEESEDTVECKECFDLFPKADCIKLDIGYVCPTCAECGVVSEDEIFKIDFPEYEKFSDGNAMVPEEPVIPEEPVEPTEEIPVADSENPENEINPISTPEEAVPFLVRDEEEAIAGYEKAAEVVAESDLENKEEILDTIEHIKEEEEEHIEELTELLDGEEEKVPEDPEDEDVKEDTEETPEEEVEEIEDPEAEPVEEAMSDFQRGLIEKLPKMTKEEFKTMLDSGDTVKIFYGDPREPGVRSRDYEVTLVDGAYEVTYWEETYNDDFTDSELAEEFDNIDDLWDFMVNFMEDDDFSPEYNYVAEALTEHVNEEHAAIESDQELEGTDNAVVDCKIADVVTHSEDEKPLHEESITEAKRDPFHEAIFEAIDYLTEFSDIFPLPENIGADDWEELKDDINYGLSSDFEIAEILMEYLNKDIAIGEKHSEIFEDDPQSELTLETYNRLKRAYDKAVADYKAAYPEDFEEQLDLTHGYPHIKSVATLVHTAVENITKDNRVGTRPDGMSFYVLSDKRSADPEKMKTVILDALAAEGYEPDEVQFVDKGQVYGYIVGKIKMMARATMSYQKRENLIEEVEDDVLATNSRGDYLVKNSSGRGYSVFSIHNVWQGGFECDSDEKAVNRFNRGDINESAVLAGVATGVIVDVVKRIMDKFGDGKKKSKWIDFRKHVIEKTPEGQINIWNHDSEQVASDLKTVAAAKEKIKELNQKAKEEKKAAKKNKNKPAATPTKDETKPKEAEVTESLTEDAEEDTYEPVSQDPQEKPKKVKMQDTTSTSGMDFEAALAKFGVEAE